MTIGALLRGTTTRVWLLLILLTLASWWLGSRREGIPTEGAERAAVSLVVVALLKARLVLGHFMEVRTAPLALRLACDAWVVVTAAVLIGLGAAG